MADENDFTMVPVSSGQVAAIGFNSSTGEGRVEFVNGSLYSYPNRTQAEYEQIINGAIEGSVGKTFNALWKYAPGYTKIS